MWKIKEDVSAKLYYLYTYVSTIIFEGLSEKQGK